MQTVFCFYAIIYLIINILCSVFIFELRIDFELNHDLKNRN